MAPPEKGPTEKGTDEARQGVTGTGTRYVLAISFTAALILLLAVTYAFFGPPRLDVDTGRAPADTNPPYATSKETPEEWRDEPPPGTSTGETP
ncbi:MAG: hypothetical protein U0942_01140 [Parvibaculum sp.]|uniref:hypothetical protein n=1 Tax=Parvibaculum sp. TaxID=2024848 RepID=UPI002AB8618F|nr:hypothetical protein [Parvibaculum sp.]MDZ4379928.1 hypothetical protein [Parvibaculum sp.]